VTRALPALCAIAALGATQPVVKTGTQLVRVTVLVRDHNGKPVTGLQAADFTVSEDGKTQPIAFFDPNESLPPTSSPAPPIVPADGTPVFSNLAGDTVRNVTVILLDRLNTAWTDQAQARDAIKKFLSQLRPEDRVALYALDGTALHILHDFTADTAALLKAASGAARITSTAVDAQSMTPEPVLGPELRTDRDSPEYMLQVLGAAAYNTVSALQAIGRHLAGTPGRKSIVWLTAGLPMDALLVHAVDRTSEIQRATRALNTSGVAVYPVDARGLIGAFSDPGTATRPPTFTTLGAVSGNVEILRSVADDTGGRVFMNSNNIAGSIRSAIDDAEAYYVLGYYAPSQSDDGRYRRIAVTTRAAGVDLRYRRGYFATQSDASGSDRKAAIERALRDVLDATSVPVTVAVGPGTLEQGIELAITADGRALALRSDQNVWTGAIDLAIAQFHDDRSMHVDTDTTVRLRLTDTQHETLLASGLTLSQHVKLAPETVRVAVVVRDATTGSIGSVFLPANRIKNTR
jgi:VWFA-related protein